MPGRPGWPEPAWWAWPDRRPRRAGPRPRNSGADQAFASGEELVEADGIDVVHICTPNHLHEPLALKALAAGKHVVLEKPVALDGAAQRGGRRRGRVRAGRHRPLRLPVQPHGPRGPARVAAGELGRCGC